jgi:hypothetical protein
MDTLFDRVFPLLAIVATVLNAYSWKRRSLMVDDPESQERYDDIFKRCLVVANLPWIVMGIGLLSGSVDGVRDFLHPRYGNPYVVIFHLVISVIWTLSVLWIYFGEGAEFLARHPGLIRFRLLMSSWDPKSPIVVKITWGFLLAGGITGMYWMWTT